MSQGTGFGSLSAFSRAYRAHFGYTARDERNLYETQRSLDFLPPINQSLAVDCRSVGQGRQASANLIHKIKPSDSNILRFSVSPLRLHYDDGPLVSEFIVSHHCGQMSQAQARQEQHGGSGRRNSGTS